VGTYLYSDQEVLNHVRRYFERAVPSLDPRIMPNLMTIIQDRKIASALGIGGLIWASTLIFSSLRTALNIVFQVEKGRSLFRGNAGGIEAAPLPAHGRDHSLSLILPPLGVLFFKREGG